MRLSIIFSILFIVCPFSQAQVNYPSTPTTSTFESIIVSAKEQINRATLSVPDVIKNEQKRVTNQHQQTELIKAEIVRQNKGRTQPIQKGLIDTNEYKKNLAAFESALLQLKNLANTANPSLSEAFYITEKAFGNPYLTKAEYEQVLNKSVSFLKKWMMENGFDINDNEAKHLAIQRFMSQRLTVSEAVQMKDGKTSYKTVSHLPFFYDYNDYEAKNDHRNFFVTKCLATGGGQCNSLPMVYLLLAEKLNTNAYLTFAPQHSFIKYINNKGEIENYEPTSNWHINDRWYQDNLFVSPEAIRSGIYLDTLNTRKVVANCMLELALQYIRKMPLDEGEFLKKCLEEAYKYYPKQNNIYAYFIYSNYLHGLLTLYLNRNHITDLSQIENDEYAYTIQKEYQKNEKYITELGYQDLPEEVYNDLIKEHEFKGEVQTQYKLTGKQKRNSFIEIK
ncbi:MAG TPA: hypothetical protein PKC41_06120 [Chitinophagaceae bacterium]|jgi:hypothetical protein|nr:hypothetical protein [Chitinophagaceae bacterium]